MGKPSRVSSGPVGSDGEKAVPQLAERAEPRVTLLLRTAKLIADDLEYLCLVRNVSQTGLKIELFHPLPQAQSYVLEMGNGDSYRVEPAWKNEKYVGFSFQSPIDLERFIDNPSEYFPPRPIRLNAPLKGLIICEAKEADLAIENLSQQGACVTCEEYLAIGAPVTIEIERLASVPAKIRWRKGQRYGLIFEQVFRFDALAQLLAPR